MPHSDYTFLGLTKSLCPECRAVVPAKIVARGGRVYFRKTCPTHGEREDFVCGDVAWYDRLEYALPAKLPVERGVEPRDGCPFDCGLCDEHEQHTCIGLVEITSSCNLTCPLCYAGSSPGGKHLSLADCRRAIDRLVEVEGRPEVLQLSGGEPTVHPEFEAILDYALAQPIDYVMLNTNGLRLASDERLVERLAAHRDRLELYFQFDGLTDDTYVRLRGEPLLDRKLAALEAAGRAGLHTNLVATLQGGVNEHELGPLVEFAIERPWITSLSLQPATYSGRHELPETLERRITFPDAIRLIDEQTHGLFRADDFLPLPCAHPNCHQIALAFREGTAVTPLTRWVDKRTNFDLLANGISFTREQSQRLVRQYLARQGCCEGGSCGPAPTGERQDLAAAGLTIVEPPGANGAAAAAAAERFFADILAERLGAADMFRITITSFLDAYNFDLRRLMKCCTHHVLPSGHVIPFCAYNVLYRDGHVPLPPLRAAVAAK